MKYLQKFQNWEKEKLTEKITWKDLLLWSTLLIGGKQIIKTGQQYNTLNKLYTQINSPESNPTKLESSKINQIREKLINQISNSQDFEKFGKKNLIDSLKVIEFKVVDSLNYIRNVSPGSNACFINLGIIKQKTRKEIKWLVNEPSQNNLIVIRKDILREQTPELTIIHELYHYLDKITKVKYQFEEFIDTNINRNKLNYTTNKYAILVRKSMREYNTNEKIENFKLYDNDGQKVDIYPLCKEKIDHYIKNKNYFSSTDEVFARWLTLKTDMIQLGIIKNNQDIITLGEVETYLDKCNEENTEQCYNILLILNWEKLIEFQEYINKLQPLP
jgi:hypothetical protein